MHSSAQHTVRKHEAWLTRGLPAPDYLSITYPGAVNPSRAAHFLK